MFQKLKKKSIEVICPACKKGQTEPALAFSTYCRNCGEHLKIVKGVARLNSGPQLSGLSTIRVVSETTPLYNSNDEEETAKKSEPAKNSDTWVKTKTRPDFKKTKKKRNGKPKNGSKPPKPKPEVIDEEEVDQPEREESLPSVAEVFGLASKEEISEADEIDEAKLPTHPNESMSLGNGAASFEKLREGSMAAMISDLVEHEEERSQKEKAEAEAKKKQAEAAAAAKKKETAEKAEPPAPGVLAEPEKPIVTKREVSKTKIKVRCFRCNHRQMESRHAESTQCGRCNTYISLADYHIRQPTDRVIRTRGNVTVHRKGSLLGSELACRNLLAMGTISTRIDCSGEARFKYSATVNGNLHCESLIVEKGTIVEFSEGVNSESVKVYGTLRGDVTCAGTVEIARSGILDGDVTARFVDRHNGGTLTGEMTIDEDLKVKLPEVKGYDPSIID